MDQVVGMSGNFGITLDFGSISAQWFTQWDIAFSYGDGSNEDHSHTIIQDKNPTDNIVTSHIYNIPGVYTATATISSIQNPSISTSKSINVIVVSPVAPTVPAMFSRKILS